MADKKKRKWLKSESVQLNATTKGAGHEDTDHRAQRAESRKPMRSTMGDAREKHKSASDMMKSMYGIKKPPVKKD